MLGYWFGNLIIAFFIHCKKNISVPAGLVSTTFLFMIYDNKIAPLTCIIHIALLYTVKKIRVKLFYIKYSQIKFSTIV